MLVLRVAELDADARVEEADGGLDLVGHDDVARVHVAVEQVVVEDHLADGLDADLGERVLDVVLDGVALADEVLHRRAAHKVLDEHVGRRERVARQRERDVVDRVEVAREPLQVVGLAPHVHLRAQRPRELVDGRGDLPPPRRLGERRDAGARAEHQRALGTSHSTRRAACRMRSRSTSTRSRAAGWTTFVGDFERDLWSDVEISSRDDRRFKDKTPEEAP